MIFAGLNVAKGNARAAQPTQEHWVTQVFRWTGPPAVVRVKTPADVIVALPRDLPARQALGLAKLVLNGREYAEFSRKIIRPQQERGR